MLLLASLALLILPQGGVIELAPTEILPHGNRVVGTATSTKGDRLFTIDSTGAVAEWDLERSEMLWKSAAHQASALAPSVSNFQFTLGKEIGARTGPSPIPGFHSVDLESGSMKQSMGLNIGDKDMTLMNATTAIAVDPKDKWIWIGAKHGVGRLMAKGSTSWSQRIIENGGVTALSIDPKGKEVAIGGEDGTIRFVGNSSCDVFEKDIFEGHKDPVTAVAWHPKGKLLASISGSSKVLFHKRRSGKIDRTLEIEGAKFSNLVFHPKGKWLAASTQKGQVVVWELKKNKVVARAPELGKDRPLDSLTIWDGGKTVMAASANGVLRYDLEALEK